MDGTILATWGKVMFEPSVAKTVEKLGDVEIVTPTLFENPKAT